MSKPPWHRPPSSTNSDTSIEEIHEWSKKRKSRLFSSFSPVHDDKTLLSTVLGFIQHFDFKVLIHMALAGVAVYLSKRYNITYDIQLSLLISPIVFPLAFAINTNFHRRDVLLGKISNFQSAAMMMYLCFREWSKDRQGLPPEWINTVYEKVKSLLFLLGEYLFTSDNEKREKIMQAIYEDFSEVSELIDELRRRKLAVPLVAKGVQMLTSMCQSFDELRVVREYRSPRSVRTFNRILILFLPVFLAPYFSNAHGKASDAWLPYVLSILTAFIFASLQGVQDKLDDPFDGIGEDDIKYSAIGDWAFKSLDIVKTQDSRRKKVAIPLPKKVNELIRVKSWSKSKKKDGVEGGKDEKEDESSNNINDSNENEVFVPIEENCTNHFPKRPQNNTLEVDFNNSARHKSNTEVINDEENIQLLDDVFHSDDVIDVIDPLVINYIPDVTLPRDKRVHFSDLPDSSEDRSEKGEV